MMFKKHIKILLVASVLLSSSNVFAQEGNYLQIYQYYYGSLCMHSMYLYNDSTFLFDTGCEQQTSFSCGRWEMSGDTILMEEERPKQNVYSVLKERDTLNDSTIVLLILDKNDQPIHRFLAVGFPNEIHHNLFQYSYSITHVPSSDTQSKKISASESNKNGYIEFPIEYTDKIKLLSLLILDEDFVIDMNGFNRITVKINTNSRIFHYPFYFGEWAEWIEEYPDKIVTHDGEKYYLKINKKE